MAGSGDETGKRRRRSSRVVRLLGASIALVMVAAACGDDDSDSSASDAADETTATTDGAADETSDIAATITIADFSFGEPVSIQPGETIRVENTDGVAHTFTADDGAFDTGTIGSGDSVELTIDESGTVEFHCEIHPSMTGTLTVGSDDDAADEGTATDETAGETPTGPADITASDQSSDGTEVVVEAVTLPADGYIVIHADSDGAPGMILGHTDLLPAGTSTDVVVTLDVPLESTATVWPMAHVDANQNAVYEFSPPDETIDVPAMFENGEVAVVPVTVTVG